MNIYTYTYIVYNMYVYVYVYVCIYIYIYTHIYTYTTLALGFNARSGGRLHHRVLRAAGGRLRDGGPEAALGGSPKGPGGGDCFTYPDSYQENVC